MSQDEEVIAQKRLLAIIAREDGTAERLLEHCAANIPRDRYVHPSRMKFIIDRHRKVGLVYGMGPTRDVWATTERVGIHGHAMGQLCDFCNLPRIWRNRTDVESEGDWRRTLLVQDLNALFEHQTFVNRLGHPAKFLHRLVGNQLRGVLTQSYNRQLVSVAVLRPFVEVCNEVGLKATSSTITDIRVGLQTYLPYVYSPFPGEYLALGAWWGNSDFGMGKAKLGMNILRISSGGEVQAPEAFGQTHIGSVVEASDMEIADSVATKELEAIAEAIQTSVRTMVSTESIDRLLAAIKQANEEQVPWASIKERLIKVLSSKETADLEKLLEDGIVDLPPAGKDSKGKPLPSKWWVSQALSHIAGKTLDVDHALELKQVAGKFLSRQKGVQDE